MKVIKKRLDDLKHPEKNVRIHSEQQIRELKRSLEKFGQTRALVVDENNVILIGNGLYEAMVSLGYQEASVYVKTELSENDKKKLMIADNKTYALGIDNLDTLNEFLEELQGDLDIPGFRTESVKDNPEGRSILRNAYRSWYFKRRIQEIEAIGIERDLAGLPVIHAPENLEIWDSQDPDMVKINGALITMVKNLRRNESEGLVLPHGYEAELLSTGGTRQFDTNAIINRYDTKIAQTVLADFIMLGHEKTGSFALSSDKTELFSVALGAFLDIICETFNNQGIPSLIDINGSHFDGIEDYPTLAHGDVDKRDITKLSTFLKDMVGTGILIPDEELEDYVREAANLPERTEVPDSREKDERREAQRRAPEKTANEPDGPEVDPEENQDAEEAKKRLGR